MNQPALAHAEQLNDILNSMQDAIMSFSLLDHSMIFASASVEDVFGYPVETFLRDPQFFRQVIHPDDLARALDAIQQCLREGYVELDHRIIRTNGEVRWLRRRGWVNYDATGRPIRVNDSARDITREKQAEAALRQSEAHLRSLLDSQTTFNVRVDMQGAISFCNDRYAQQFNWMAPSLIGLPSLQMVLPEDHDRVRTAVTQCSECVGTPVQVELRKYTQDGGHLWTLWEFIAVQDASGAINEVQCVGFDITQQKQAELALRQAHDLLEQRVQERTLALEEERRLFRQFVEAAPVATIITDVAGVIVLINQEGGKLFGYACDALIGQSIDRLIPDSLREIHARHRAAYLVQPTRHSVSALELTAQRQDGAIFPVEIQLSYVRNTPAPLVMCQVIDISARKAAEATLRQALAQEQELGELRSRIVSMASHEFRTPLTAILASTETLTLYRNRMDDVQIAASLNRIRRQVDHMQGILEDVLQLARSQAGSVEFNPAPGDLAALCREITDEFESITAYQGRVQCHCPAALPPMRFDLRLMRHVITNLISNALKYSATEQPVQVHLRQSQGQVVFQVNDAGIGIPADDIKHLFAPFHRAANVGAISGTGLGLSIVKQAVELHGGAITIDSQLGEGTKVTVTIPLPGIES
jgi:PAS domain S-box-containing protein